MYSAASARARTPSKMVVASRRDSPLPSNSDFEGVDPFVAVVIDNLNGDRARFGTGMRRVSVRQRAE
jgi:hypothetical protein